MMFAASLRTAVLLALLASCAPGAAAESPAAHAPAPVSLRGNAAAAAATVDLFHAALGRGDTEAAAALVADEALIFEEGGAERSKAEYSAHHLPADAEFSKAVRATRTGRRGGGGGDLAWVATESRTAGTFRGRPVDRVMAETMVLRRVAGAWRIVHIHWSSRPAPPPAAAEPG